MEKEENLKIALLTDGSIFDDLIQEMLDHQGICYDVISKTGHTSESYPAALVRSESSTKSLVRSFCDSDGIIEADAKSDLQFVLSSLSGHDEERKDRLEFRVNTEEEKLVGAIKERFTKLGLPFVRKRFWPGTASAALVVTHDIDWLTYSPLHKAVFQSPIGIRKTMMLLIVGLLRRKNYGWNIPTIIELEKKQGIKSTFFFQTNYGKDEAIAANSFKLVNEAGFEVGLHGYHDSHKSSTALKSEVDTLIRTSGKQPRGLRYHILKFRTPETWWLESDFGFEYDATFYYNEFFGSRANICFPFHPFGESNRFPITELPTSFMDWTALRRKCRGEELSSKMQEIKRAVEAHNGVLTLNFHNTYINSATFPDVFQAFELIITNCRSSSYWIATANECVEWWKARASSKASVAWDETNGVVISESNVPLTGEYKGKEVDMQSHTP